MWAPFAASLIPQPAADTTAFAAREALDAAEVEVDRTRAAAAAATTAVQGAEDAAATTAAAAAAANAAAHAGDAASLAASPA